MPNTKIQKEILIELKRINANLELNRQHFFHKIFSGNCKRCEELKKIIREVKQDA